MNGPTDPLPKEQERLLVAHAADGDNQAVAALYDAYEQRLFGYCRRITNNQEDAADATQEAFCNVIQRLPGLDAETLNFGAYLFTAARNACMDILKQQGRFETSDEVPEDPFAVAPLESDPERSLLTADQQRAAQEANERLPEKQRTALAMREVAELSYDDIAAALDMNQNAVAQLISRARINFGKQLRTGAVVIPPSNADAERAIELTAARIDGKIDDADLSWLNAHLNENEQSRINSEAMQESAVLYRAIGPIVVLAGLRDAVLARAAESTDGPEAETKLSEAADTQVMQTASIGTVAAASQAQSESEPEAEEDSSSNRRKVIYATLACVALLVTLLLVTTGNESATPDTASERVTETIATGATGEPRSGDAPDDKQEPKNSQNKSSGQSPALSQGAPNSNGRSDSGDDKKTSSNPKNDKDDDGRPPSSSPPASDPAPSQPDPVPPAEPEPNPPGGGGGGIPGGPGNICSQPPCTPPPPVP